MKTLAIVSAACGIAFMGAASAANITVYYSPTCPHCHHARDFISNTLVYEYPNLTVSEVNVTVPENSSVVNDAFAKFEYESRGVPVIVIGDKCFQGFGENVKEPMRAAIEIDLSDAQKQSANENRAHLAENHDDFVAKNAKRLDAVVTKEGDAKKIK